jgi:hypothetical protein
MLIASLTARFITEPVAVHSSQRLENNRARGSPSCGCGKTLNAAFTSDEFSRPS